MSKQHMEMVGRSMADLNKVKKAPTIKRIVLPTQFITKDELAEGATALELAAENLKRKKSARAQAEAELLASVSEFTVWMTDIGLRHIADINRYVAELGLEYLEEEYVGGGETTQEEGQPEESKEADADKKPFTVGDRLKELMKSIDDNLNCGDPRVSLPLEATEIAFWLSIKPFSKEELTAEAQRLAADNVLCLDRHGNIEVFRTNYSLHKRFDEITEPQRTEVKRKIIDAIRSQAKRLGEENEQAALVKAAQVRAKIEEFIRDSDLPILDVLDETKTGQCGALVSGGAIWFQVSADSIELLDVTGAPENGYANLVEIEGAYPGCKISVARSSLKRKDGALAKASDAPRIEVPLEISKDTDDNDRWINAGKFAWHSVRGAIELALTCQRKAAQGLYPKEFHDGELGRYRPTTEKFRFKFFNHGTKEVAEEIPLADANIEVERFENPCSVDTLIRITDYNPEFKDVLTRAGCLSSQGYLEGDRYTSCPMLIRLLLQNDFRERIAEKSRETQKGNGHSKNGHDTQTAESHTAEVQVAK